MDHDISTSRLPLSTTLKDGSTADANANPTAKVSELLFAGNQDHAVLVLDQMAQKSIRPKLGAVQRWVRQVDAAGLSDFHAIRTLSAILRTFTPLVTLPETLLSSGIFVNAERTVRKFPAFTGSCATETTPFFGVRELSDVARAKYTPYFKECAFIAGPQRKPPNHHDLRIYTAKDEICKELFQAPAMSSTAKKTFLLVETGT